MERQPRTTKAKLRELILLKQDELSDLWIDTVSFTGKAVTHDVRGQTFKWFIINT